MVSSLGKETARIAELIKQEQLGEVETHWNEALQKAPTELETFFSLADRLTRSGHAEKAGSLLEQVAVKLDSLGQGRMAVSVVAEIARISPRNANQKQLATTVFTNAYGTMAGFDKVLARATAAAKDNENRFVKALYDEMKFQPGDWLFHDAGWGLGQVRELDADCGEIKINFADKQDHRVKMGAAAAFFRLLPNEDIMVQRAADLDGLKLRCKDEPLAVVMSILKSHGNKSTLKRVKAELVPAAIDTKSWSKWWTNVRKELARHQYVRVGTGANPALERLVTAMTLEDETREQFENAYRLLAKLAIARRSLRDSEAGPARQQLCEHIAKAAADFAARSGDLDSRPRDGAPCLAAERIVASFLHEDVKQAEPGVTVTLQQPVDDLLRSGADVLKRIEDVRDADYQQRALERHASLDEAGWPKTFAGAFLKDLPPLWDHIARRLMEGGHETQLAGSIRKVVDAPEKFPLQYQWVARRGILGGKLPANLALDPAHELFTRLLWVVNKVLTQIERGETHHKETLASLRASMTERQSRMLATVLEGLSEDRAAHLLHEIERCRGLSDIHSAALRDQVGRVFPSLQSRAALKAAEAIEEEAGREILATANGLRKRQAELKRIQEEDLPEVAKAIGEALAMGDISENAELDAAREKEARLKEQAKEIMDELKRVKVIEPESVDATRAGFGTRVTLKGEDGKKRVYEIFGRYEASLEQGIISNESPIAQGIVGKKPGETAVVQTPEGAVKYEVIGVERAS
ncbi:MAG: GreA/GreB family elongation factor [Planctomycetes bacterium]|nr:GreA/GreB family elongation factor [Planctomycetota bacterium]